MEDEHRHQRRKRLSLTIIFFPGSHYAWNDNFQIDFSFLLFGFTILFHFGSTAGKIMYMLFWGIIIHMDSLWVRALFGRQRTNLDLNERMGCGRLNMTGLETRWEVLCCLGLLKSMDLISQIWFEIWTAKWYYRNQSIGSLAF